LLDDAVRHVTAQADALDRIRHGVRRRRTAHRAGTVLLALAVLAASGSTALALTSSRGPAGLFSPDTVSGEQRPAAGGTPSSASAFSSGVALGPAPAPTADPSRDAAAKAAYPAAGQAARWDMDGDGRPDTAAIVSVGNAKTTVSFLLVVHLTRLGTQSVPFTATSVTGMPPRGPVIVGAVDAAHDGHAELFVQVDAGCCTEFWTIFRLVDSHVYQMSISGQPVRLPVGGSVMANGGFSCDGPDLVTYGYQPRTEASTFLATRAIYRWAAATLVLVSQQQTTIHGPPADPALAKYSGVDCGDLPQYISAG